jgi:hypothetical protein
LKAHKKLTKGERGHWDIKELSRTLEDHVHNAASKNEWDKATRASEVARTGY